MHGTSHLTGHAFHGASFLNGEKKKWEEYGCVIANKQHSSGTLCGPYQQPWRFALN
jgi:hypothetical protein